MFGESVVTENGNLGAGSGESGKLALGSIENGGCFRKWGFEDCLNRIFFFYDFLWFKRVFFFSRVDRLTEVD